MPIISVFTPTYNRAHLLPTLYKSLQSQTFRDFQWIIVDDGSTDNTEEVVKNWINENDFSITYYKQPNGGKCSAINRGLDMAEGKLFFNVDSDDYLTPDALEKILKWESMLPNDEKFCGVSGNLGLSENETPNSMFESGYFDGTLLDRYGKVTGERALAFYTEVHRKYKYPVFNGENFMTEAVTWNRMARDGYKMRFHNDIIWIYEYQPDGLTKSGNNVFLNNPMGYGLWLREKSRIMGEGIVDRFKMYYTFTCDLSEKYDTELIADAIGAPKLLISAIKTVRKILGK